MITIFYSNERNKDIMVEQTKKSQAEEVRLLCDGALESMRVAEDISVHICGDEKVRQIVSRVEQKDYKNEEEFQNDCLELDFIDDYLSNFEEEIYSIKIYVENQTVTSNKYIDGIGRENEAETDKYSTAGDYAGTPFWTYTEIGTERYITLLRAVMNERGETTGILRILLRMDRLRERLGEQSVDTVLLYNTDKVLTASGWKGPADMNFVYEKLEHQTKDRGTFLASKEVKDYLVSYEKVYPSKTQEYYTIICMQDYRELILNNTKTNFFSIGMAILGMGFSVILIFIFSGMYGKRIKKLRLQMHRVANGEYEAVEKIEGMDEVGQIYQELEQMIQDIKGLTTRISDEKVQKEKLHTKQKEVEFKMLASQINPHFLYNTLETIRMKAKINHEPEIEELVKMLAKIMRRNIQVSDQMVTLQSEIELLENYLVIQKYRFGDRIRSEVQVEQDIDTRCEVLPLIIQPFVENAFIHGLESKDEGGSLRVHIYRKKEDICISIEDNGRGMDFYRLNEIRKGLREGKSPEGHIGIGNVNQRLRILYGEGYGVQIDSELNRGTRVLLSFPE